MPVGRREVYASGTKMPDGPSEVLAAYSKSTKNLIIMDAIDLKMKKYIFGNVKKHEKLTK